MREVLRDWGVSIDPRWTNDTEYHLEVKTTPFHCEHKFFVTDYQIYKVRPRGLIETMLSVNHHWTLLNGLQMKKYDRNQADHACILVRVFRINAAEPKVAFFVNPWKLMENKVLELDENDRRGNSIPVYIQPGSWTAVEL